MLLLFDARVFVHSSCTALPLSKLARQEHTDVHREQLQLLPRNVEELHRHANLGCRNQTGVILFLLGWGGAIARWNMFPSCC